MLFSHSFPCALVVPILLHLLTILTLSPIPPPHGHFWLSRNQSTPPEHGKITLYLRVGADSGCLLSGFQMDKRKDPSSVDIKKVLLEMRKFRMGLIQTADQLRFSYLAVIEGAKFIMGDSSVQVSIASAFHPGVLISNFCL